MQRLATLFVVLLATHSSLTPTSWAQQPNASLDLTQGEVTAGDQVQLKLALEKPAACSTQSGVTFGDSGQNHTFSISGDTTEGQTSVKLKGTIPKDIPAGEYRST